MNKETLKGLFSESLFQIPDYQRGYAWEKKQQQDFIQDIDALVEDEVQSHYTGTIVVYCGRNAKEQSYGINSLKVVDIVDGQQRLTTSCLYLAVVLRELIKKGQKDYESAVSEFLYSGATSKLTLNNDTADIFYDLIKTGRANTETRTPHEARLVEAHNRFVSHIEKEMGLRGEKGVEYLKNLFIGITKKLHFTFFTIEEECEIGMTFELMNSRGKGLSVLELLKNYLMHWVYRNAEEKEKAGITQLINKNWKDAYTNIGQCNGDEDQCLRVAWILYCSHTPKNWIGYDGFKGDSYMPLRNFTKKSREETEAFVQKFSDGLAEISRLYASIMSPAQSESVLPNELVWLAKIHRSGNTANFLPLLVAAQKQRENGVVSEDEYVDLLQSLECYAYRVFLFDGRRSNAGKSSFYRWGFEVFTSKRNIRDVTQDVHRLARHYATEDSFFEKNSRPSNWYGSRHRLKYTLFEYELKCLKDKGKNMWPKLEWRNLKDSTLEHILPQNPKTDSQWLVDWAAEDIEECLHDIGNLVLTKNNANYSNFEYERKLGKPGVSPSYSDSDIRQERRMACHTTWNREEFDVRRNELIQWINHRWATVPAPVDVDIEVDDEADEDGIDSLATVMV
jgi:hypothetical protein